MLADLAGRVAFDKPWNPPLRSVRPASINPRKIKAAVVYRPLRVFPVGGPAGGENVTRPFYSLERPGIAATAASHKILGYDLRENPDTVLDSHRAALHPGGVG